MSGPISPARPARPEPAYRISGQLAARDGCGVAVGTSILCAEDLRRGTLVRLFDVSVPAPNPYFVICPGPAARASAESFVEMFVAQIGAA